MMVISMRLRFLTLGVLVVLFTTLFGCLIRTSKSISEQYKYDRKPWGHLKTRCLTCVLRNSA